MAALKALNPENDDSFTVSIDFTSQDRPRRPSQTTGCAWRKPPLPARLVWEGCIFLRSWILRPPKEYLLRDTPYPPCRKATSSGGGLTQPRGMPKGMRGRIYSLRDNRPRISPQVAGGWLPSIAYWYCYRYFPSYCYCCFCCCFLFSAATAPLQEGQTALLAKIQNCRPGV